MLYYCEQYAHDFIAPLRTRPPYAAARLWRVAPRTRSRRVHAHAHARLTPQTLALRARARLWRVRLGLGPVARRGLLG